MQISAHILEKFAALEIPVHIGALPVHINYISVTTHLSFSYKRSHDCFEFHYMLSGEEMVLIDEQLCKVRENHCYFIGPNVSHAVLRSAPHCKMLINFEMKTAARPAAGNAAHAREESALLAGLLHEIKFWIGEDTKNCIGLIDQICHEVSRKEIGYFAKIQHLLSALLISSIQTMAAGRRFSYPVPERRNGPIAIRIVQYILERYPQEIDIGDAAAQFGLSTRHLNRIMKKHIGLTFRQLLTHVRVETAKHYFATSDLTVKKVAENVGFASQYYLSKVFKSVEGETVGEFRSKVHSRT